MTDTRTARLSQVWDIYQDLMDDDVLLHDRREYDQEMLAEMYLLSEEQSHYLHLLIKLQFDPNYKSLYDIIPSNKKEPDATERQEAVCEVIGESMHQSLDGWSDGEKVIITLYLMDLGIATNLTYKSYKNK